jgi:glycosyltransferase involved in cell wall biosynthesis/SAM-dependent methyltransferase
MSRDLPLSTAQPLASGSPHTVAESPALEELDCEQVGSDAAASPPSVSIVITTYNHAGYLGEAIESALAQTVSPYEIIVVDDGSMDEPGSVLSGYPKVQFIRQANQGPSAARNTGWRAATGRYVVFLDADDRLMPNALASNLHRFQQKPECAFVYGSYFHVDASGKQRGSPPVELIGEDAYESLLLRNCVAMHATVMYRRDCLVEVGGFDAQLRGCEDYELYLRLARRYRVAAGVDRIAEYRHHDSNATHNIPLMLDTALEVLRRQSANLSDNPQWRKALTTGVRDWKSHYVQAQLSQAQAVARASGLRHIPWSAVAKVSARAPGTVVGVSGRFILKKLRRALSRIELGSVGFGDLRRLRPISANFGFDRGKPLDRRYIEDFLSRNAADIRGRVLEVADNAYTMQFGGTRVTQSDVLHADPNNPRATLVGDLADGHNFPSRAFDCIVLTQTLHFIFDMQKAVATLHRMLKPGGVLLVTVPGISCIEHDANWPPLWTVSPIALRRLLDAKFGEANVNVTVYGNVLAAVSFLHGLAESELQPAELDAHDPEYPVTVAARAVRRDQNDDANVAKS